VDQVNVGQELVSQCQWQEKYLVMEVRIVSESVDRMGKHFHGIPTCKKSA